MSAWMLPEGEVRKRRAVINTFERFEYLDKDSFGTRCPICDEPMRVTFKGRVVELFCTDGCAEHDVANTLGWTTAA